TVDSGNLLGCLLAFRHGLEEKAKGQVPSSFLRAGFMDVLGLVGQSFQSLELPGESVKPQAVANFEGLVQELDRHLQEAPTNALDWDEWLQRLHRTVERLTEQVQKFADAIGEPVEELDHWAKCLANQVTDRRDELVSLMPWLSALRTGPDEFAASSSA